MEYNVRIFMNFPNVLTEEEINTYLGMTQIMVFGRFPGLKYGEFTVISPSIEMIKQKQTYYIINFNCVGEANCVTSSDIFECVHTMYSDMMVQVRDVRFIGSDKPYYWTNDGQSTYSDGGTYVDCEYVFHVGQEADYRVIHIPTYIKTKLRTNQSSRYKEYENHTFMWEATATWNNWLNATTVDDALAEFENIYYNKLVKTVHARQTSLDNSINELKQFAEYKGTILDKNVCNGKTIELLDNIIQYCRDQIGFEDYFERDRLVSYLNALKEHY